MTWWTIVVVLIVAIIVVVFIAFLISNAAPAQSAIADFSRGMQK